MIEKPIRATPPIWLFAALTFLGPAVPAAQAGSSGMKVQVLLIWATNDPKSPKPEHKPVEADIRKKLEELPLKWSHYFEEKRKVLEIPKGEMQRVSMSGTCETELKNTDGSRIEITHFGKGKNLGTRSQAFPKGEIIALGGNAPNSTGWLLVLKRVE
jgi:hypothetical protein